MKRVYINPDCNRIWKSWREDSENKKQTNRRKNKGNLHDKSCEIQEKCIAACHKK